VKRDQTVHERLVPLLVNIIGAKCYLELGVYTFNTIRKVKKYNPDCRCVGVDMKWHCPTPPGIEFHLSTTDHFFVHNADGLEPDVVFIDADHSYKSVNSDFANSWEIVQPEGLILLHDSNPETEADTDPGLCGDGWKYIKEISALSNFEAVTLPFHPGLTIVRKRVKWGPAANG
jgi:hypothetical protein